MHLHIFVSSGYKNIILNPAEKPPAEGTGGKDHEHLRNHVSRENARFFLESFGMHFRMKLSRKGEIPFLGRYHHRQRAMTKVMRKTKARLR